MTSALLGNDGQRLPPDVAASTAADRATRMITIGLLATAILVALQAATQAVNFGVFDLRVWAFDCDRRYSVFGIASLLAQLAAGVACVWRSRRVDRDHWAWLTLGMLVIVLVPIRGLTIYSAAVLAPPLACVLVLMLWLTWRDPVLTRTIVWAAVILMMTSLALHEVGPDADASLASDYTWSYQITGMVKHGAELAGWLLLALGVLAGLQRDPGSD